ncbi:MAG: hypothetical protein LBC40_08470 [Dysgonamonadaceae bacterium]|jgi:hypothetical protein|nr:hypothetical protein [Dysgonamonadaceae bacterium]
MSTENDQTAIAIAEENLNEAIQQLSEAIAAEEKAAAAIMPDSTMRAIIGFVNQAKGYFAAYDTPLTTTDRRRLFGTGFKYTGFIDAAYEGAVTNPNLLPSYMPATKFKDDVDDYSRKHNLYVIVDQFAREIWDSMLTSSDTAYRDALDYYNSVKEASHRHIAGADAEYNRLKSYFKKSKPLTDQPTEMEIERDVRALLHGTKEGRVVIENKLPEVAATERKVVDEVHSGHVAEKEVIEAERKI